MQFTITRTADGNFVIPPAMLQEFLSGGPPAAPAPQNRVWRDVAAAPAAGKAGPPKVVTAPAAPGQQAQQRQGGPFYNRGGAYVPVGAPGWRQQRHQQQYNGQRGGPQNMAGKPPRQPPQQNTQPQQQQQQWNANPQAPQQYGTHPGQQQRPRQAFQGRAGNWPRGGPRAPPQQTTTTTQATTTTRPPPAPTTTPTIAKVKGEYAAESAVWAMQVATDRLSFEAFEGKVAMYRAGLVFLKSQIGGAHPLSTENGYYYCTVPSCAYFSRSEDTCLAHIRRDHPGAKTFPRYLGKKIGGIPNLGATCSLSAVGSLMVRVPGAELAAPALTEAARTGSYEMTRSIAEELNATGLCAPATLLARMAAANPMYQEAFGGKAREFAMCPACGWTAHGETTLINGIVSIRPDGNRPVKVDSAAVCRAAAPAERVGPNCAGSRDPHPPTPTTFSWAMTFGRIVALSIKPWGELTVGVEELPCELVLPTDNHSQPYRLHGVVVEKTARHVTAYVWSAGRGRWDEYDGSIVREGIAPPNWCTVTLAVYICQPPAEEDEGEAEAEDTPTEETGVLALMAPPSPPPPPRPRDEFGEFLMGMLSGGGLEGDAAPEAAQEEENILAEGGAPPPARRRRGEDGRRGGEGAPPAGTPHPTPGNRTTEQNERQQGNAAAPEGPPQGEAPPQEGQETETQDSRFAHQIFADTPRIVVCPAPGCGHKSAARDRTRRGVLLRDHINTRHTREVRETIPTATLTAAGLVLCLGCGVVVPASRRGRAAHKCGAFHPRAERIRVRRADYARDFEEEDIRGWEAAARQAQDRTREDEHEAEDGVPETMFDAWASRRPRTIRVLHRSQWKNWIEVCRGTFLGYTAASREDRERRQERVTDLVRDSLVAGGPRGPKNSTPAGGRSTGHGARGGAPPGNESGLFPASGRETPEEEGAVTEGGGVPDDTPPHITQARRLTELVALGAAGKAAREAAQPRTDHVELVEEVRNQVQDLFPPDRGLDNFGWPTPPGPTPPALWLTKAAVHKAVVRGLSRGAAPGVDGWTRELLIPLCQDDALLGEITEFIRDILGGAVGGRVAARLRACPLTLLKKPNGGLRPITPESVWLKVASIVGLAKIKAAIQEDFKNIQEGVFGNVEVAVRRCRARFLEGPPPPPPPPPPQEEGEGDTREGPEDEEAEERGRETSTTHNTPPQKQVLLALDARNAYNTVSRTQVLAKVYRDTRYAPLWGVVALSLGAPGAVVAYENGAAKFIIASRGGVRQGMVLGPLLFSLVTLEALKTARRQNPEVFITAYLDDVILIGPAAAAETAREDVQREFGLLGVECVPEKTVAIGDRSGTGLGGCPVPGSNPFTAHLFHDPQQNAEENPIYKILGAGFAKQMSQETMASWLENHARQHQRLFDTLRDGSLPKAVSWRILAVAALPRLNFLCRTHPPDWMQKAVGWFDGEVDKVLRHLVGKDLTPQARELATLPVRMGGAGVRRLSEIGPLAFDNVGVKGGQRQATATLDSEKFSGLYTTLSRASRTLVVAGGARGAGRPLTDPQVLLPNRAFEVYLRQRLLTRVLPDGSVCVCGADASNHHVHTCARLRGNPRRYRHDMVARALAHTFGELGLFAALEPTAGDGTKGRPDIFVQGAGTFAATDVSIVYPASLAYISTEPQTRGSQGERENTQETQATQEARVEEETAPPPPLPPLRAARRRAQEKTHQWGAWAGAREVDFAPVVFETTGGVAPVTREWLKRVSGTPGARGITATPLDMLLSAAAVAMHCGTAASFEAARGPMRV